MTGKNRTAIYQILKKHSSWDAIEKISTQLQSHGYQCLLAGGCVRDALLGKTAKDLDIATNATPDDIQRLFSRTVAVGKSFGVMRVLMNDVDIEVATFRRDGDYVDGRHPNEIVYSTYKEDAWRRDFTMNGLFFDPYKQELIDLVGGEQDIKNKTIRCVGVPEQRFKEDHLRILRAIRFAAQLNFDIEEKTWGAIQKNYEWILTVSRERIREEWTRFLRSSFIDKGWFYAAGSGIMDLLFSFAKNDEEYFKFHQFQCSEDWQYWSVFLCHLPQNKKNEVLSSLKLSKKEIQNIEAFLNTFQDPQKFSIQRWGIQIIEYEKVGVQFAIKILNQNNFDALIKKWQDLEGKLPRPLVNGDDLKDLWQGKELGDILKEVYLQQIENNWTQVFQAQEWIKTRKSI